MQRWTTVLLFLLALATVTAAGAAGRVEAQDDTPPQPHAPGVTFPSFHALAIGVPAEDVNGRADAGAVNILYPLNGSLQDGGSQLWTQGTASVPGEPEENNRFGEALTSGHFNHDRHPDLVIGAPLDTVEDPFDDEVHAQVGSATVLYGSGEENGLSSATAELWSQAHLSLGDEAETGDGFGRALTSGDFDDDGYDDLAVGAPWEEVGGHDDAGQVNIVPGSYVGLVDWETQFWHQNKTGVADEAEPLDWFGYALAAGDLDGDGYDDLAVGAPYEDIGGESEAGAVHIFFGTSDGLSQFESQFISQADEEISGIPEAGDRFGWSLAAADFDQDGYTDLAIGVPGEGAGGYDDYGFFHVIYGSASRYDRSHEQFWDRSQYATAHPGDRLGFSLSAGRFDDDGYADLAIGAPYADVDGHADAGLVDILYGTATGLHSAGHRTRTQAQATGAVEDGDQFGRTLAAGEYSADGFAYGDLAVGAPWDSVNGNDAAGAVNVFYSDKEGIQGNGQLWTQDEEIGGVAEENDHFGQALANLAPRSALPPVVPISSITFDAPTTGTVDESYEIEWAVGPGNATLPVHLLWEVTDHGSGGALAFNLSVSTLYSWQTSGTKTIEVSAVGPEGTQVNKTHTIEIIDAIDPYDYFFYLPHLVR